jgi:spore maturation protein CgeB
MKIVLFYHSLVSDWNHGNAHFLRGIASELIDRGNDVRIYEPRDNWSRTNLLKDTGAKAISWFHEYYPALSSIEYDPANIRLDEVLEGADLVIVHEWNEHEIVKAIGTQRKKGSFKLLFHDTHHRAVTEEESMSKYDLTEYDGVLAFGNVIRNIYLEKKWAQRAWTWHEAADTRVFRPLPSTQNDGDLVWVGNWGDDERTKELHEFLIEPVQELQLKARIHGVRYPVKARNALKKAGIEYAGWLPNFRAPEVFSRFRFTVHVPRRPYVLALPGIPTIRPFEAMACGIPLISAPWEDREGLFTAGKDYVVAQNKEEMKYWMNRVCTDDAFVEEMTAHALQTIAQNHTCAHRVDELLAICSELGISTLSKTLMA